MMRLWRRIALALLAGLLAGPALALQESDATPQDAVRQDLYQDALQSIAEGRRNDASAELRRLVDREPLHAGAWLDLALTQCALGHGDEAERLFAIIETRFEPNPAMLQLIAETREAGCARWQPRSTFALTAGRGIDQNVNQGASRSNYLIDSPGGPIEYALSSDFLPHHDQYTVVGADATRELSSNGSIGFAQFLARHNDRMHRYDSTALFAGIDTPWRFGGWTLRTTGSIGAVTLGGHYYQRQAQVQARIGAPLALPRGMLFNVLAGATRTEFETLENFDSQTYELRGLFSWRGDGRYASASLGRLRDRASEQRPGGSRQGWYGNVLLRHALPYRTTGEFAYTAQSWNGSLPYSTGLIDVVRRQVTQSLRATLTYPLTKNQLLQIEGRAVHNRENISLFQYNNRQLQLSWLWQY